MKRYIAEFVGTFVLVFASCGAAVIAGEVIGFAGVSFAFGLSLLAMIYTIGPISGCHINPAVTLGIILCKKMDAKYAPGYMLAQVLGAIVGAAVLVTLPQLLTVFREYEHLVLGLLIMLFMIFLREGIVPSLRAIFAARLRTRAAG